MLYMYIYVHKAFNKHLKFGTQMTYIISVIFVISGWTTEDSLAEHSATSSRAEGFNGKSNF